MNNTRQTLITAFALFSLFFGAGNLILPPYLGYISPENWILVTTGFSISAVVIPILGIYAHARLQGTMLDFANKVSPVFSLCFCAVIYLISISLPSPRTASVTHEMAVAPLFDIPSYVTSSMYFFLVFLVAINRSKVVDWIGRFLTPMILFLLILMIILSFLLPAGTTLGIQESTLGITDGILEGYQTFDAIGAVVVGAVIIVSLNLKGNFSYDEKKKLITRSGLLAGLALLLVYGGLIATGAQFTTGSNSLLSRSELLNHIAGSTLGAHGRIFLSVLITLACFTTAVGIVMGTADFAREVLKHKKNSYTFTVATGCLLGIVIGQLDVNSIIAIAYPVLLLAYPLIICYILLNTLPEHFAGPLVFRIITVVAVAFSIPEALNAIVPSLVPGSLLKAIPLASYSLGWVLPVMISFAITMVIKKPAKYTT